MYFLEGLFRWIHVVAGVLWIGLLYFFNWVNSAFVPTMDAETKKKVVPELMPRALFWFRWGAAWTWITGILLAGLIYYQSRMVLFDDTHQKNNPWLWLAVTLILWAVGFVIYNLIMKSLANKVVGAIICLLLYAGVWAVLEYCGHYSPRAMYIHAGATFGTMMALNVWMIIWPYQQKIIRALKDGNPLPATDPIVTTAGLRSRHNTYMSVPLVFFMISNHYPTMYGNPYRDLCATGVIVLAFLVTRGLYAKAPKVPGI